MNLKDIELRCLKYWKRYDKIPTHIIMNHMEYYEFLENVKFDQCLDDGLKSLHLELILDGKCPDGFKLRYSPDTR